MSDKNKLTDLQVEIDEAYKCVSMLQIAGDAVDVIAAARSHLRKAFELAGKQGEAKNDG